MGLIVLFGIVFQINQNRKINTLKKQSSSLNKILTSNISKEDEYADLELKLKDKTIELAKQAKNNKDKSNILSAIRNKIADIELNPSKTKRRVSEIRRLLDSYLEKEGQIFEIQIDEINQQFYKDLKKKYPDLSLYDLRLSAYLKMGMKSKEIAKILNVLPSSINVSRSRLRKKLGLPPEEDLYEFMNG